MQHKQIDLRKWFRDSGYERWVKRVQRLIKVHRETKLTEHELRECQRFILEFGHFNANFSIDELEALLYPKSPTATMAGHSYLRSHQTIAAEILREHFSVDHQIKNAGKLYPLFYRLKCAMGRCQAFLSYD